MVQFIPGRLTFPHGPLARYRPVQPDRAVDAYVRRLTQPGDLVVDLFCQGPAVVREAVDAGRRALGFSVNPLLLLAAHLGLTRPATAALNAAFARLVDSLKGDVPLRHHLPSLYRSACPTCGTPGIAEWFAWNRDENYPFKKAVRCPECEAVQEGLADDDDVESGLRFQSRGLAYYYALDRVAPLGHQGRERAAQLVELYTPRNLSALMDLAMRLEGLAADEEVTLALAGVLLECFDAGSSLDPFDEQRPRPRTLRTPSRYVERNVWLCFEQGFSDLLETTPPLSAQRAADAAALVRGEAEGYALLSHAARDARESIPPGSAALVFVDPPQPDGIFWALSALWAGWLWDSAPAHALRPFLRRRRFDWDWHRRMLQTALEAARPLLAPGGHLVTAFSGPDHALLTSTCLAVCGAGYEPEGWGYSPGIGYRLAWRWSAQAVDAGRDDDVETIARESLTVAQDAMERALRERGEPTERSLLHASACAGLVESGLLARAATISPDSENKDAARPNAEVFTLVADAVDHAFDAATIVRLTEQGEAEETLYWLADSDRAAEPLADRVGGYVCELLDQRPAWNPDELVNAVYAHFPGPLTPDLALVLICVDSYSVQEGKTLHMRPEDDSLRRAAELRSLRGDLAELGARLGFEVQWRGSWDVRWLREEREAYVFDVSATAALGRHLLARRAVDEGALRCLVIPGGRAALVGFKVQRDPRLARAVTEDGWQFVKFRHVRRLHTEKDLDRHALKTVLGLDPIVEQEAVQIPLF